MSHLFVYYSRNINNCYGDKVAASFLASATLIPLDMLDPEQQRAQELELRDQIKGDVAPDWNWTRLVRFANRALLAVIGDEVPQWLAARHQVGVGVRGGVEILQFMVRAALDASPDWADMQGDASNAFNEFLRRHLFEKLSSNPALPALLRVATQFNMAAYLPCTFTTPLVLMARQYVSRVPVAPFKVVCSGPCSSL
jgi:hypothetical protein